MTVRFLAPAEHELDDAISYYNAEVAGLGDAFLLEVISALDRIRHFPDAWHPLSENTRRCQLKRFPYALIYEASDSGVLIVAVANLHRHPAYWKSRTS